MKAGALDGIEVLEGRTSLMAIFLLLFAIPCLIGILGGVSIAAVLGFLLSTFLLQGFAPAAGIGLGFPVYLLLPFLVSVAAGVILGIFRVCDLFSEKSPWVAGHIGKVRDLMERHEILKAYGEYMLIPLMWVPGLGLYGTPALAWILHWRSIRSVLLMLTGWIIACLAVLGLVEGILAVFFSKI
ncbi:MAG TPA: hypothetical protein VMT31_07005 [Methanomicrobiales archaeon]|jgi:hypothetical protein|nr:hypothetical protein [Methanomicrobiales archaeon]